MPFTDHTVEVDNCKTHYRRAGKGTPVVFLHGASGAPVVLPFMEKLATRYDVIVPDHPGYGLSDEPEWLENIHDVAYFYLDFLQALKLEKAVVIGSSMAGWMAMEMAARNTARIGAVGRGGCATRGGSARWWWWPRGVGSPKAPSRRTSSCCRRRRGCASSSTIESWA